MNYPDKNLISLIGTSLNIELAPKVSMSELAKIIADYINPLISNNFNKLISILYRLDINESKLKQLLNDHPSDDAGMIIADLIIERQIQKIKSRKIFNSKNNIDEDEKW